MTEDGGSNDSGVIFKVNRDGTGYTNLYEFGSSGDDGQDPLGSLLLLNDRLYGMTQLGGVSNVGVVFMYSEIPEPSFFVICPLLIAIYYLLQKGVSYV